MGTYFPAVLPYGIKKGFLPVFCRVHHLGLASGCSMHNRDILPYTFPMPIPSPWPRQTPSLASHPQILNGSWPTSLPIGNPNSVCSHGSNNPNPSHDEDGVVGGAANIMPHRHPKGAATMLSCPVPYTHLHPTATSPLHHPTDPIGQNTKTNQPSAQPNPTPIPNLN